VLHKKNPSTLSKIINNDEKKRKPEWVGILCGPQTSQCIKSKAEWVAIELSGKDNLVCFANGKILQL